ncbi:MAG: substrate-binding domain-containing protein [Gemmatimonadota bacterium]|nr:substrate-binding domain-containing protein [Gemmatimonadota bacterium]
MRLALSLSPRRSALRAALLVLGVAAGACGGGDDSGWGRGFGGGGRKRVGIALPSRSHPFYQELEAGLRAGARRARYELVVTDANFDAAAQRAQAEGLLQQRIDALVIAPADTLAIVPALERANGARVPVFTANLRPAGGRMVSHVQSDHVAMGRVAAEYLAAFLGGRGEVIVVTRAGIPWLAEREQGFRAAMRAHRGITVVDSADGAGARERTLALLEPLLRARRETDAIFGVDDAAALGAYDAALARFRADLLIVGCDASPQTVQVIQSEGPLKASILQQPRRMGEQVIQLMVRHFDDEPVAPRVLVPIRLVNVDSLRPAGRPAR